MMTWIVDNFPFCVLCAVLVWLGVEMAGIDEPPGGW